LTVCWQRLDRRPEEASRRLTADRQKSDRRLEEIDSVLGEV
jgi:hypothetical protein